MASPETLLDQIERDVLDESASVAGALRKCLALGGQSGSEELRDWATVELQGYKDLTVTPLPAYRVVPASVMIDGFSGNLHVKRQSISTSVLPEVIRDEIKNEVQFRQGIGELEALIAQGEQDGIVRLGLPMGAEIARLMSLELASQYSSVERIYWSVAPAAIRGVTDQVRTALTQLVAELRAATPRGEEVPSSEAVHQAIQVAVHGKRARVNVTSALASGDASATVGSPAAEEPDTGFWTRPKQIGAFIVGTAGVAGAVFGGIRAF